MRPAGELAAVPATVAAFREALDDLDARTSELAGSAQLGDVLRLLGHLQAEAGRLGQIVAYVEHVALQRGASSGTLPDGTRVERTAGRWSYVWDSHRKVVRECSPELLAQLKAAGAEQLAEQLVQRITSLLPKNVPWKAGEVNRYTLASELRTGERGRDTLRVSFPSETGAPAV